MTSVVLRSPRDLNSQRGVTLIIALIMLIAMTLAGLAMIRQIGAGVIVARNLTFRESALVSADRGVEAARTWLRNQTTSVLENAIPTQGYYAAWCNVSVNGANVPDANNDGNTDTCDDGDPLTAPPSEFIASAYNWNNASHVAAENGNEVDFVIHRMCRVPGAINVADQQCVTVSSVAEGTTKRDLGAGEIPLTTTVQPYFRVTARVVGPMNTVVYTQTIIY